MKIGFVRRGYSPTGGAEAYLLRLAREIHAAGESAFLITTCEWPADSWPFGEIVRVAGKSPLDFCKGIKSLRQDCDLLFSLERVPGCDIYRAGDGVHAAWMERRNAFEPWWRRLLRPINRKHAILCALEKQVFDASATRAVIANSRMVRDEILARFDYPAARIHVIPNGVGSTLELPSREAARRRLDIPPDVFCPVFLGTGWDRKGLRIAQDAVGMVDGALLLVAGKGPADAFRDDHTRFLGPVRDIASLFAASDVLLLPTWYDPFSNACLEAAGAGLPVITTHANGFSEILEPQIHGSVIPVGDSLAAAEALEFWRDSRVREKSRIACRELATRYSIAQNAASTLDIIRSLHPAHGKSKTSES